MVCQYIQLPSVSVLIESLYNFTHVLTTNIVELILEVSSCSEGNYVKVALVD